MNARQHLVEEWKAKLAASAEHGTARSGRLSWIRQIYTRVYRFLVSYYGEGDWRGDDESNARVDSTSTVSHMPFVAYGPLTDGLLPKSPERIRAALKSIHNSNPGLVMTGTTTAMAKDDWVVVAARKKSRVARDVRRGLRRSGIEARLQNRKTDTAIVVRHKDFEAAVELIRSTPDLAERIVKNVDPVHAIGIFLFVSSSLTLLAIFFMHGWSSRSGPFVMYALLWIAGLMSAWLCTRRGESR